MYLKLYSLILIKIFILITNSKCDSLNKCSYEYTVDLTTSKQLKNNSYLFNNDTLITPDLVDDLSFKILNNGTRIDSVKPYKRGCICAILKCMRFCSNQVAEFYKNYSSPDIDKGFIKNVTLSNKKTIEKHLIHDFHTIFGSVCEFENSRMLAPELYPDNKWTLFEDGILLRHHDMRNLTQNEYCFDINEFEDNTFQYLNPVVCDEIKPLRQWLHKYGLVFSIPFFIIIIGFYCFLSNLSNVREKCFITYLSLITLTYTLVSFYRISGVQFTILSCQIYGYVIYYTTIGANTWSCILFYDAWKTLTHIVSEQSSFIKYSIFGFSVPLLVTILAFTANSVTKLWKQGNCAVITINLESALIYYNIPGLIVVLYSLTLYTLILRYSWKTEREQIRYYHEILEPQLKRLIIYFRIFFLMGFEWIFISLLHILRILRLDNTQIVVITLYVSGSITTFQGVFMFLIFICRSRVLNKINKRFSKISSSIRIKE